MAIKFNKENAANSLGSALKKTTKISKDAVQSAQHGAVELYDKAKSDRKIRKTKKYNAIFLDQFTAKDFFLPNLIRIVDDAVRRDIEACEGAIGWLSIEKGMEILHLYDEAIEVSGINFVPTPRCDAIYYVDSFDRNRFINIDSIFNQAHEERLAELKHIAYSLGATRCVIQISESSTTSRLSWSKADLKAQDPLNSDSAILKRGWINTNINQENRSGSIIATFNGSNTPVPPQLKWFSYDNNIKRLIEMRCNNQNGNNILSETLEIKGATSRTMSQKTAYSIDAIIKKIGMKSSLGMESNAMRESLSKLIFTIEFPRMD